MNLGFQSGLKPCEFWDLTLSELIIFVEAVAEARFNEYNFYAKIFTGHELRKKEANESSEFITLEKIDDINEFLKNNA